MTEMIVNMGMRPRLFRPMPPAKRIDALAFVGALLLAPIVVALLFFWILLIPVFAIPFGMPLYLMMGIPGFLWALSYRNWPPLAFAALGLAMIAAATLIGVALHHGGYGRVIDIDFVWFYAVFGFVHAPIWAFAFGHLYNKFKRY